MELKNMSCKDRPMLSVEEQVEHLEKKGVKFEIVSKEEATQYLKDNNNYFKLRAYRKNYLKDKNEKYINLEFAYLKDLAIIDMRMRYVFIHLALDIEHYAKVNLLHAIENSNFDGYDIVNEYLESLKEKDNETNSHKYDSLINEISRHKSSPYCGGIIDKYDGDYPIWAFIEIISFGSFILFYNFCASKLNNTNLEDEVYLLKSVKEIRNASAHSNCIINDLLSRNTQYRTSYAVCRSISGLTKFGISKTKINTQLKNVRMQQITTLLYTHSRMVTSKGVHEQATKSLKELIERINKNIKYYDENDAIKKSFIFFEKVVEILFVV